MENSPNPDSRNVITDNDRPQSPSRQCRDFFGSEMLPSLLSFLPIHFITMVMCTRNFSLSDRSAALGIILQRIGEYIPEVKLSAWHTALSSVPQRDVIPTINHVYLSFVHSVGISRNLTHEHIELFNEYWIDFATGGSDSPRELADWRYSGYFASRQFRVWLCKTFEKFGERVTNSYTSSDEPHHTLAVRTRRLNYYQQFTGICNFLKELTETSFSLEWLNIDGQRWAFSEMHLVTQDTPKLYISVSRADVDRLNAVYAANQTFQTRFRPFDYDLTSTIRYMNDYHYDAPLPDPPH